MEKKLRKKLPGGKFRGVTAQTSKTMSAIRGKHTKSTELALRMALVRARIKGWTMHPCNLQGIPDIYFPEAKVAVFVDGCFWHGCPRCGHIPKTNTQFWRTKIARNQERDQQTTRRLRANGISVVRIWEHALKKPERSARVVDRIRKTCCVHTNPLPTS